MSRDNFLSFLQQILTMLDEKNPSSVALAKQSLSAVAELARISNKTDALTLRTMMIALYNFEHLAQNRKDYIGEPGDYQQNHMRRQRLMQVLYPSC